MFAHGSRRHLEGISRMHRTPSFLIVGIVLIYAFFAMLITWEVACRLSRRWGRWKEK
jgi:hypothetical protein